MKLKIKLNFKILLFIFLISNVIFSQGIFIPKNYKNILSFSAFYSKHEKVKDYNYGLIFGSTWKGKVQFNLSYSKSTEYFNINEVWNEFGSLSVKYFIKSNQILNYGLSTTSSISVRDSLSSKSSFSFIINSEFNGSPGTGMVYYPYIKIKKVFDGDYFDVLKNINNLDLYVYENFYEFGFFATFNDLWIRPYFIKGAKSDAIFSGIEIGFWDY